MTRAYLLDTSVLSLLAPVRPDSNRQVSDWLQRNSHRLYISTITLTEIEQGICKLSRNGAATRAKLVPQWLDGLMATGAERILPFDSAAGRFAGRLSDKAIAAGRHPGFADVAIAATAGVHDLIVLSLNGRHFEPLGSGLISTK